MIIVSDASPLRSLHFLGLLSILKGLYGDVVVPTAVEEELLVSRIRLDPIHLSQYDFIQFRSPSEQSQVSVFLKALHRGESEALALGLELQADLILIDELAGRHAATEIGLRPLGTLSVLLQAKVNGHIAEIRPLVGKLKRQFGFFVSAQLEGHVLRLAGE